MANDPRDPAHKTTDPAPRAEGVLRSEFDGPAEKDGIPANGTEPSRPPMPDDTGA